MNLFSYSGAFSVAALAAGATRAVDVDSSEAALELSREHRRANSLPVSAEDFARADVFDDIRSRAAAGEQWDIVVCDPPAFAKRRGDVAAAARGYKDVNRLAMTLVRPGGILLTCSCSGHVDPDLFQKIVFSAALDAGTSFSILARQGAGGDHPVSLECPEGEYLKGLWLSRGCEGRGGSGARALLAGPRAAEPPGRVLVFSRTTGFRHDSIPDGIAAIRRLGNEHGFAVDATEDASVFADETLAPYSAVVFLIDDGRRARRFAAGRLRAIPREGERVSPASTPRRTPSTTGPGTAGWSARTSRAIRRSSAASMRDRRLRSRLDRMLPRSLDPHRRVVQLRNPTLAGGVHVLAALDERTYTGGTMGGDHPISWCRFYEGGRSWYTALGHTRESYSEPLFLEHLLGGIQFAAGWPECATTRD